MCFGWGATDLALSSIACRRAHLYLVDMIEGRPRLEGAISCRLGTNLRLGFGVFVSAGCELIDEGPIEIADDVILGQGVRIVSAENRGVTIEAGVWLGDKAEVRPGVKVGAGAMVCGGSIVEDNVPANALVEGRPAKVTWYLR
jgi:acetyltransferase-like isoleucine patch superfamily enzyme